MVILGQCSVRGSLSVLPAGFWAAVDVWVQKPQVLNRRLCGSQSHQDAGSDRWLASVRKDLCQAGGGEEDVEILHSIAEQGNLASVLLRTLIPKANPHYSSEPSSELVIKDISNGVVTFIPFKKVEEENVQVNRSNVYQIHLAHFKDDEWFISVLVLYSDGWKSDGVVYPKPEWLVNELLPKLAKWSSEPKKSDFKSTLSLISVIPYSKLYQELKEKYKEMVKALGCPVHPWEEEGVLDILCWDPNSCPQFYFHCLRCGQVCSKITVWPEVTDPEKFVYEDVAIATYLLIIWEDERTKKRLTRKQSFVDLGCGNGLLVHILSNEGHRGKGLDVRRRKIWDLYGERTNLEECAITPNDDFLFPDVDWIIGNHSDELTPWIPVIASRSSYSCCYFVLPCCFFNFYGKYSRRESKKTQYREYLDFITEVGITCGFDVEEDCLRIPSTKRVCLIGKSRTYQLKDEALIDEQRKEYIKKQQSDVITKKYFSTCSITDCMQVSHHCSHSDAANSDEKEQQQCPYPEDNKKTSESRAWISGFLPREKNEQTRNCATLPRDFIDQVVLQVASLLLDTAKEDQVECVSEENAKSWNCGSSLPLKEVAEYLDRETLQRLKNECGGLQTLLRNNHQVFEVHEARVHIRDWRKEKAAKRAKLEFRRKPSSDLLKTRLCWFFMNHPDGCPLLSEFCLFAHGANELRQPQVAKTKRQIH